MAAPVGNLPTPSRVDGQHPSVVEVAVPLSCERPRQQPGAERGEPVGCIGDADGATAPSSYTVVEGDSLSSIAERFHGPDVSIGKFLDALYDANGLTEDSMLSLGQVLRIPR